MAWMARPDTLAPTRPGIDLDDPEEMLPAFETAEAGRTAVGLSVCRSLVEGRGAGLRAKRKEVGSCATSGPSALTADNEPRVRPA